MTEPKRHHCFMQPLTVTEVEQSLRMNPQLFRNYQNMNTFWKQRFLDYFAGRKTLPFTYDPFFKRIFHPDIYQERLSRLISSILGQEVKVVKVLPQEETVLDMDTLLIMDILVQLEDGSLTNIEIQKVPYHFSEERMSCYSADLLMRQYSRSKAANGSQFQYSDVKKVYTIVIFEKSRKEYHEKGLGYRHYGKTVFDSGLKINMMQEYCLICLDVFRKTKYTESVEINELNGWLSFLAIDDVDEAERLLDDYPWLEEIYRDAMQNLSKPEEVLSMFSEALKTMDRNTVLYMIEEQQKEIAEKDAVIIEKDAVISEKDTVITEKDTVIAEKEAELTRREELHAAEIERYKKLLKQAGIDLK